MTDDLLRPPFGGEDDDETRDTRADQRTRELPAHEEDADEAVGAGVMGAGGTAVDRGTGQLSGTAEGPGAAEDEEAGDVDEGAVVINEGAVMGPPSGGAQHYVPAVIEDDDKEDGGAIPSA